MHDDDAMEAHRAAPDDEPVNRGAAGLLGGLEALRGEPPAQMPAWVFALIPVQGHA